MKCKAWGDAMKTAWIRLRTAVCVLVVFGISIGPAQARQQLTYQIYVSGVLMGCNTYNNYPVAIFASHSVDQYIGVASKTYNGKPYIILGPGFLNNVPPLAAQFWFLHECAHHALHPSINSETNADCYAVRNLRNLGLVSSQYDLQSMLQSIYVLQGSSQHLPGPARAQNIYNCLSS